MKWSDRPRRIPTLWGDLALKRVRLALKDDVALVGVVLRERGGVLELAEVEVRDPASGGWSRADGHVIVERSRIVFAQVLNPEPFA